MTRKKIITNRDKKEKKRIENAISRSLSNTLQISTDATMTINEMKLLSDKHPECMPVGVSCTGLISKAKQFKREVDNYKETFERIINSPVPPS